MLEASLVAQKSLSLHLTSQSRAYLTADLQLTSLQPLGAEEIEKVRSTYRPVAISSTIDLMTHLVAGQKSELVSLKAIDSHFPLVGDVQVSGSESLQKILQAGDAALERSLAQDLGLQIGDLIQLGGLTIRVGGWVDADAGGVRLSFAQGPSVYIPISQAGSTGLLQMGSQVYYRTYLKLAAVSAEVPASPLPQLFVRTAKDSVETLAKALDVALQVLDIALLFIIGLCFVVGFYSYHMLLRRRTELLGLLDCFGASQLQRNVYGLALALILTLMSFLVSTVFVQMMCLVLQPILQVRLILPGLQIAYLAGAFAIQGFLMWFSEKLFLDQTTVAELFQKRSAFSQIGSRKSLGFLFFGMLTAVLIASFWLKKMNLLMGFTLVLAISTLLSLLILPWGVARIYRKHSLNVVSLAIRNLKRVSVASTLLFLAFFLGFTTQSTLLHLTQSVVTEITPTEGQPQFFITNIRPDDVLPLQEYVKDLGGQLNDPSPLFLARLRKINDSEVQSDFFQKFPVRLTETEALKPSEIILQEIPAASEAPPISIEVEYAKRNGLKLGDILEFELEGLPVTGQIRQVRQVLWSQFQPNFFMQFRKGVLSDFPASWIATVTGLQPDQVLQLRSALNREFPASLFDIRRIVEKLSVILSEVERPLRLTLMGLVLLCTLLALTVVLHQMRERQSEIAVLEISGASRRQMLAYLLIEFTVVLLICLVVSQVLSLGLAWSATHYVLNIPFRTAIVQSFLTCSIGLAVAALPIAWAISKVHSLRDSTD